MEVRAGPGQLLSALGALICAFVLTACSTGPHAVRQATRPTAGQTAGTSPARGAEPQPPFTKLEGVYRQGRRSFVVTYQGWWLDMRSEQIRQLSPLGRADFGYGPGWQTSEPTQGRLHFELDAAGDPVRVTGMGPGHVRVNAARVQVRASDVRIKSHGAVLAATITIPPGPGRHPGIVIVQGSGPLDRHFE